MIDLKKLETTEFYNHRYRNFSTVIIVPTAILFVLLLLFLIFAKREVTVLTAAEIAPVKTAVTVQGTRRHVAGVSRCCSSCTIESA